MRAYAIGSIFFFLDTNKRCAKTSLLSFSFQIRKISLWSMKKVKNWRMKYRFESEKGKMIIIFFNRVLTPKEVKSFPDWKFFKLPRIKSEKPCF